MSNERRVTDDKRKRKTKQKTNNPSSEALPIKSIHACIETLFCLDIASGETVAPTSVVDCTAIIRNRRSLGSRVTRFMDVYDPEYARSKVGVIVILPFEDGELLSLRSLRDIGALA